MQFAMENREAAVEEHKAKGNTKFGIGDLAPYHKAKWDAMSAEDKAARAEDYKERMVKYNEELKAWKESDAGKKMQSSLDKTNEKRKRTNKNASASAREAKKQKVAPAAAAAEPA